MKCQLPGMHVSQIDGFVTNVYGDSPTTTIMVDLQLAGLPKDSSNTGDPYLSAYTGGTFTVKQFHGEVPAGAVNGTNSAFTVTSAPTTGTLDLYRNGLLQKVTLDYTLSGTTITTTTAPVDGEWLFARYRA
jgi:hypothetical protein